MIFRRISSRTACSEIASFTRIPSSASLRICGTNPEVERVIRDGLMPSPFGELIQRSARTPGQFYPGGAGAALDQQNLIDDFGRAQLPLKRYQSRRTERAAVGAA